ncbi:MAG TPA: hypothetical protein VE090_00230 [Methylomirabilota bacterium]|nr:hypothetical protein [Methylomirabilota bacterium]
MALKLSVFTMIALLAALAFSSPVFAQTTDKNAGVDAAATLGVARMVEVKNSTVKDGSILSTSNQGAFPSNISYDPQVVGVVSRDAGVILNSDNNPNTSVPVISVGAVYVLVSSKEGPIKKGDLITTSTIPGVGVKANDGGYVLGTALEGYDNPDSKRIDKIAVDLNLHYFNSKPSLAGSLSDIFKIALLPTKDAPAPLFKYIVAALVVCGSFVLGFMSFGRTAAKGVEALGRNPAASKIIHLGIIFNVFIVIMIVLSGLTVAFLILRL